jgi:hypothetical protein
MNPNQMNPSLNHLILFIFLIIIDLILLFIYFHDTVHQNVALHIITLHYTYECI